MLSRLKNIFKVPDLRGKILFTVLVIAIYRLGTYIPAPYVDHGEVTALQKEAEQGGIAQLLSLFTGGGLERGAIFALGIMPYITSSIIMQLLTVVIPRLEQWQQEGQTGQKKITQWTRYLTVGLALLQSSGIVYKKFAILGSGLAQIQGIDIIPNLNVWRGTVIVLALVAGTALIMWLGELITQRGIGNGMSILIFASVVADFPGNFATIWENKGAQIFLVVCIVFILMIAGVVFVEQGQRRIPVQFAKRVVGRRMYGGQSTYIPMKVNTSGVIPVIFASSLLQFPALIASATPWQGFQDFVNQNLLGTSTTSTFYMVTYTILIIFFAYFYTAIAFNPQQQADVIRKQGGFIPGIRPGPPTEKYLAKTLNRITLPGSLFLAVIALAPLLLFRFVDIATFQFGGTALLITVGVGLETMKQIDSQLMMRNYEGFLSS